jgi:hypothetical protein
MQNAMSRRLDRDYGEKSFNRGVSVFLSVVFLLFVGYILVRYRYFSYILKDELFHTSLFGWVALAYVAVFALVLLLIFRANKRGGQSPLAWSAGIFALALALRLAVYSVVQYVPISDFSNYYQMGVAFVNGDYAFIAGKAASYHIPDFSGLAVINGVLLRLFGTSVRSFQLVHCVIASLNAVAVYLVARRVDKRSAPLAGALFALYPANVFYAQATSNQHIAVLFALLSILLLLYACEAGKPWKSVVFALASGALLLASQYAHPSTATTQIAFALFLLTRVISALIRKRRWVRPAVTFAVLFAAFFGLHAAGNAALIHNGLLDAETTDSSCYLTKVVIGLNSETQGSYSASDWGTVWAYPTDEQNDVCIAMIRERWAQNDMPELLDTKVLRLWMVKDTSIGAALFGMKEQAQAGSAGGAGAVQDEAIRRLDAFADACQLLDFFYVAACFLFAWLGVLLRRRDRGATDLLIWVVLGQMGVYLFIEIQTRYRYFAMPLLMILAAAGVVRVLEAVGKAGRKRKGQRCE